MTGLPADADRLWLEIAALHEGDAAVATFDELAARFERPVVHGPDVDGEVWLSGERGQLRSAVNLTASHPELAADALAWKAANPQS